MFAVPGWSLSASDLKVQIEKGRKREEKRGREGDEEVPARVQTDHDNDTNRNVQTITDKRSQSTSSSRKRKRENSQWDPNRKPGVALGELSGNLDDLFKRYIEGRDPNKHVPVGGRNEPMSKKEKKRKKRENAKQVTTSFGEVENNDGSDSARVSGAVSVRPGGERNDKAKSMTKVKTKQPQKTDGAHQPQLQPQTPALAAPLSSATHQGTKLTPLQQKMRDKLESARFRHLNETLYTTPSTEALALFTANPELFAEYHAGFSRQVRESWPSNPVDSYTLAIRKRAAVRPTQKKTNPDSAAFSRTLPLPRRPNSICTIADLGCGDAQLARAVTPSAKKFNLRFLSYDLHAPDPLITKADISNLPVGDGSVDIVVFCLSLMGTNWITFVEEAWRVLRGDGKGECWVSEVKSRFGKVNRKKAQIGRQKVNSSPLSNTQKKKVQKSAKRKNGEGGVDLSDGDDEGVEIYAEDAAATHEGGGADETDVSAFVEVFRRRGLVLRPDSVDKSNKMFVKLEFVKQGTPTRGKYAGVATKPGHNSLSAAKQFLKREQSDLSTEEEAKVLKPCVYKIR